MTVTGHIISVLTQITRWIPDRIIENLARKHRIQTRTFSATSHVLAMVYARLAHALSLNDICDSLSNHAGTLAQIRNCTPPSRNDLSRANMTRNADMANVWEKRRVCANFTLAPLPFDFILLAPSSPPPTLHT